MSRVWLENFPFLMSLIFDTKLNMGSDIDWLHYVHHDDISYLLFSTFFAIGLRKFDDGCMVFNFIRYKILQQSYYNHSFLLVIRSVILYQNNTGHILHFQPILLICVCHSFLSRIVWTLQIVKRPQDSLLSSSLTWFIEVRKILKDLKLKLNIIYIRHSE